jgi:alpha-beta hydrolase superfamily lysophospholipase
MTTFIKNDSAREWMMPENAVAILVIIHGMAEYSGRYRPIMQFLAERGIGCFRFDQKGHGMAVQSETERGDIPRFEDFVNDAVAIIENVRRRHAGLPVFVWGHSMGAIVTVLTAGKLAQQGPGKLRGVITSGAPIASFDSYSSAYLSIAKWMARIVPRLRMKRPFNPERLSRDLEVGRLYAVDPLVPRQLTLRFLVGLSGACVECLRVARQLRMPWLAMHGSDDLMAPPIGSQRLIDALSSTDKQLRLWLGGRHEVHNEIEPMRTEFLTAMAEWIRQRA